MGSKSFIAAAAVVAALVAAGCGGSQDSTSYWQANFAGGTKLYMSTVISNGGVSGWAKYGDGGYEHYEGTVNSDGTLSVTAYAGDTLAINGSSMLATTSEGTTHWTQISASAYKSAGGYSS